MESNVPPGFRFHPTDEELVGYYLKKKIASQKIDLDVIRDIDLYRIEPWDLQERCKLGKEEQKEWYFFSHKDKKYPTGTRTNRATLAGFWKATGRDKGVYNKGKLIGMRKTLVFYKGRAPHGLKTDWIIHEYRLESDCNNGLPQEEGWVVCRAFKKKTSTQPKNMDGWPESAYMYNETSVLTSVIDPIFITKQPQNTNFFSNNLLCKQEMKSEALTNFIMNSSSVDSFLDLPQLESPSQLAMIRNKPCTNSLISLVNNDNNNNGEKLTTDWRALDKFVASQLSQDPQLLDHHHNNNNQRVLSFNDDDHQEFSNSDIEAFLLLQGKEDEIIEGSKLLSGVLGSSPSNGDNIAHVAIFN